MTFNHDKTQVLLITNGHFPKWTNKEIPNVDANAEKLETAFIGIVGIPKNNIHRLSDKDSRSILSEFQKIGKKCAGKDSTLIVYYAGHGVPVSSQGLFWATADTEVEERELIYGTAIRTSDIRNMLENNCNAERKILIADCCYAADFLEGKQGDLAGFMEKNMAEIKGTFFMFSSNSDSESTFPVDKKDEPTFFTDALLLSLQEGLEPDQEYCTVGKIYTKVVENISRLKTRYNKAIPEPDKKIGGNAEDYILFKNPHYKDHAETDLNKLLLNPDKDEILKWIENNEYHPKVIEAIKILKTYESADIELSNADLLPDDQRGMALLNIADQYFYIIDIRTRALGKYKNRNAVSAKPNQLEATKTFDSIRGESDKMVSTNPRSA